MNCSIFCSGLKTLPNAIAKKVEDKVRCNWRLVSLRAASDGVYELVYDTEDGKQTVRAKSVGLTAPSYVVSDLLKPVVPDAASALANVDYPPVCAVTLAYPESAIKACMPFYRHCLLFARSQSLLFLMQTTLAANVRFRSLHFGSLFGAIGKDTGCYYESRDFFINVGGPYRMSARQRTVPCQASASCIHAHKV
jgi:hypothetical protein